MYSGKGKLITFKLLHSISANHSNESQFASNSENFPTQLYESIVVNPFLTNEIISHLDLNKFLRVNILAERKKLYEAEKLLGVFRNNK